MTRLAHTADNGACNVPECYQYGRAGREHDVLAHREHDARADRYAAAGAAADATVANGGGTFDAATLAPLTLTEGYAVGVHRGTWRTVAPSDRVALAETIGECAAHVLAMSSPDDTTVPRRAVGTWIDGGMVYVDPVAIVDNLTGALAIGAANGQLAVWSFADGAAIDVA